MSVAEMKLAAINQISNIASEDQLKEVLDYLSNLGKKSGDKEYNLSQHFDAVVAQYGDVLKKLAE